MTNFQRAYKSWQQQEFPPGGRDDDFEEVHADLALVDTWVGETVIPFVNRGVLEPAQVDVIGTLSVLRCRADALAAKSTTSDQRNLAREYLRYIDLLRQVYEEFLKTTG